MNVMVLACDLLKVVIFFFQYKALKTAETISVGKSSGN